MRRNECFRKEVAVRIQVGDVVQPVADTHLHCRGLHAHVRRQFQRPEGTRETDLFGVVDLRIAHHHDGVFRHGLFEGIDQRIRRWFMQVRANEFSGKDAPGELRSKTIDRETHRTRTSDFLCRVNARAG